MSHSTLCFNTAHLLSAFSVFLFGSTFPQARIVGGHEVEFPRKYPFTVSFVKDGSHFCGGTLIASDVVLTAAHCMVYSVFDAQIGVYARSEAGTDSCVETIPVSSFVKHELYDDNTLENDIAIVYLSSPSAYPAIVGISENGPLTWEPVTVAGWGTLTAGGSSPDILNEAEVYYVQRQMCIDHSNYTADHILAGMTCAYHPTRDACQGDSGGPLFRIAMNESNPAPLTFHLVGIVSWGVGCANEDFPGVYTDVTYYISWIQSKMSMTGILFSGWVPDTPTEPDFIRGDDENTATHAPCASGSATTDTGTFAHPGVPGELYLNNEDCTFEINVTAGMHIELNATFFRVEYGWDFVYVYRGIGPNKVMIARLTGSDLNFNRRGGDLNPGRRLLGDSNLVGVPRQFLEHFQWLEQQIEQAPSEAHKGMLRIQLQKGQSVAQEISARDHATADSLPPMTYPWDPIIVNTSEATLRFTSDSEIVDEGFSIDWKAVPAREFEGGGSSVCGPTIPNVFVVTTTPPNSEPIKQLVTDACAASVLPDMHELCMYAEEVFVNGQMFHIIRNITGTNPGDPLTPTEC